MAVMNGHSYPQVRIYSNITRTSTLVSLPLTNLQGGLVESVEVRQLKHTVIGFDLDTETDLQRIYGYKINWSLSYTEFMNGSVLFNDVKRIIEASKQGQRLFLRPRIDYINREFEVLLINDTFDLGLTKGGEAAFHRGLVLNFRTTYLVQDLKWFLQAPNDYVIISDDMILDLRTT